MLKDECPLFSRAGLMTSGVIGMFTIILWMMGYKQLAEVS
jgi:hypothetical protein